MLHTERLLLRPYTEADFPFVYRMNSDPEVMRYIRPPATEEGPVRERLAMWARYTADNPDMLHLLMESRESGQLLGLVICRQVEFLPGQDLEVGYSLAPEAQGKGYASEAVRAVQAYAVRQLGASRMVAFTDAENLASHRVLLRCGFVHTGEQHIYETDNWKWEWVPGSEFTAFKN